MWGQKSFDASRFPDPAGMIQTLHDEDVHFMISIWPNMDEKCENYKEMKEKGVGVAGVVLDTTDEKGNQDEEAVKKAGILQEKTKAEYPFLIPDTTMMNGRLQGISAFPETFFVDKDGNIVGDTYTGSHTLDEWKEIVEKELKNVSK